MTEEKRKFDEWMEHFTCNDPDWKVPARYMDPSRLERFFNKFDKFEAQYPKWTDDLYSGLPTYYCMLCVGKKTTAEELKRAYELKKRHSFYPPEMIERAYDALNTEKKRATYDKVLSLFLKISQSLTPREKRELIELHDKGLELEKKDATWEYIKENRGAWLALLYRGAPTFYEVLGVDTDVDMEELAMESKSDSRLKEEVQKIMKNPQLRFEYDFMLDFMDEMLDDDDWAAIEEQRALWRGTDELYLILLERYDDLKRYGKIKHEHGDWENYTGEKTFYDVLNIEVAAIPDDKREAESFIRSAYKALERTPEVNLAYSILKNVRLRADYEWLLKNEGGLRRQLHELGIDDGEEIALEVQ
ncbi:MAG: hypothetical protein WAV32_02640 [Halobacteriota archaeon]